jgi:SM-20-related protein
VAPSAADDLASIGWHVCGGFLAPADVAALRAAAQLRESRGEFRPAHIGAGISQQARADLRGDWIGWLEPPLVAAELAVTRALEAMRTALNRELTLGLFETELHYARYAPGAAYARHSDQPRGVSDRVVSLVIYLNEAWRDVDGGKLRLYLEPESVDVTPSGGRLVMFMSGNLEHEVLASTRERLSVTGWLRRRHSSTR